MPRKPIWKEVVKAISSKYLERHQDWRITAGNQEFCGDRHLLFLGGIRRPWNEHLTVHPVNRHFCTEQRRHAWLRSKIHRASRQSLRVSDLPHSSSRPSSDNTLWTSYVQHLLAADLKVNSVMPCYSFQFQYRHVNSPDSLSNISPKVSSENMTHIKGNILYWWFSLFSSPACLISIDI